MSLFTSPALQKVGKGTAEKILYDCRKLVWGMVRTWHCVVVCSRHWKRGKVMGTSDRKNSVEL